MRTTEINIVELDASGNYRDRTSHNKKKCYMVYWYPNEEFVLKINWLNIENREFNGKKWEGMGWESKKNFILYGLN